MQVLYEDKAMTISWNENVNVIESVWKGFASSESYRKPLEKLLELMTSKKATKLLTDMTNMSAVSQSDQRWTETDFAPRLIETGVKYLVMVHPATPIGKMSLKAMQKAVEELDLPYDQFNTDNLEEGRGWLRNRP